MKDAESIAPTVDSLLRVALERAHALQNLPESTYRLQFHKGFTFDDAIKIVPYVAKLGITHCYASPYLKSTSGSTHGYDVTEHGVINPEIGGEEGLNRWVEALRAHGMSHILDIVPNHAGVATNDNPWWNDVLENGPSSHYGAYFDISWNGSPRAELHGRVLLPLLGAPYATVLEKGELKLAFDPHQGGFFVHYYQRQFPIAPCSYIRILSHRLGELHRSLPDDDPSLIEYLSILSSIRHLPDRCDTSAEQIAERHREKQHIKRRLAGLSARSAVVHDFIQRNVEIFNGRAGDPRSFDLLDDLLTHQCYRLAYWANASDEINYRRFFDVNDLAALSMEREDVFEATHELILQLAAKGTVSGLRIDHPDGLYDPKQYLARLQLHFIAECARESVPEQDWPRVKRELLARMERDTPLELYAVVEKILAVGEPLPESWPVHGTSGYDFLNMVNGLFVNRDSEEAFTKLYEEITGDATTFAELVYGKKRLILESALASELHMLAYQLDRIAQQDRHSRDFTFNGLRNALREVIACFPVYRSYISAEGANDTDRQQIQFAVDRAIDRNPKVDASIFQFVGETALRDHTFAGKFQQVTSPVTAKGVEDTAFYIYHRLISLNEVGGDPEQFGVTPDALHAYLQDRQQHWPHALSALSTHDTKRSEDVRARINVLSEIPDEWRAHVTRWREINRASGAPAPDEEYLLYQTLLGAWPIEVERAQSYMIKAMREAKLRTSWTAPNEHHETAVKEFVARILSDEKFLADFRPFQQRVAHFGAINSLSQTLLKIAAPGVPDTYQGTELPDFSLVDPDNRRPVDYAKRQSLMERTSDDQKLHLTARALNARRELAPLFSVGDYIRLNAVGSKADHVFAFARRHEKHTAVCVVPRLVTKLDASQWKDTRLDWPELKGLRNVFTGDGVSTLLVAELLKQFPVALLVG